MRLYQGNLLYENGLENLTYDTLLEMAGVYRKEYYRCKRRKNKITYLQRLIDCKRQLYLKEFKIYGEQLEKLQY